jgi:hypothetical protein
MAFPGEMLKVTIPAKVHVVSSMYQFEVEVEYCFWEDGSYTPFSTKMIVPGYPQAVFPIQFKEQLLKDKNFHETMKAHIQKIRQYEMIK